jgi:hypothetical protein
MEENYDYLIETLEKSVEKNGEKPLTNKWLLNLLKSVRKRIDNEDDFLHIEGIGDDFY